MASLGRTAVAAEDRAARPPSRLLANFEGSRIPLLSAFCSEPDRSPTRIAKAKASYKNCPSPGFPPVHRVRSAHQPSQCAGMLWVMALSICCVNVHPLELNMKSRLKLFKECDFSTIAPRCEQRARHLMSKYRKIGRVVSSNTV